MLSFLQSKTKDHSIPRLRLQALFWQQKVTAHNCVNGGLRAALMSHLLIGLRVSISTSQANERNFEQ